MLKLRFTTFGCNFVEEHYWCIFAPAHSFFLSVCYRKVRWLASPHAIKQSGTMSRLQKLQDEIIEVQIQIRDLEEQRTILKRRLNMKLSTLLRDKKILKKVRPIDTFGRENGF
jgi:hypothetical protein